MPKPLVHIDRDFRGGGYLRVGETYMCGVPIDWNTLHGGRLWFELITCEPCLTALNMYEHGKPPPQRYLRDMAAQQGAGGK